MDGDKPMFDKIEMAIMKHMMATTCQSRTAEIINEEFCLSDIKERMTQVKIRHRYEKAIYKLDKLQKMDPKYVRYYGLLILIKNNLYKLHEVVLPHFDRGNRAVFSLEN
jgi:hypothetical protein